MDLTHQNLTEGYRLDYDPERMIFTIHIHPRIHEAIMRRHLNRNDLPDYRCIYHDILPLTAEDEYRWGYGGYLAIEKGDEKTWPTWTCSFEQCRSVLYFCNGLCSMAELFKRLNVELEKHNMTYGRMPTSLQLGVIQPLVPLHDPGFFAMRASLSPHAIERIQERDRHSIGMSIQKALEQAYDMIHSTAALPGLLQGHVLKKVIIIGQDRKELRFTLGAIEDRPQYVAAHGATSDTGFHIQPLDQLILLAGFARLFGEISS